MTEQAAIKYLQITKDCAEDGSVGELQKQMCDMAISALEKQIPKKAKLENREIIRHRHNFKGKPKWEKLIKEDWFCPNCRFPVSKDNYCDYCGQRLDWSDTD